MRTPPRQQFRIAREGKGWIAVAPEFRNLESSPFGYAMCPDGAIAQLLTNSEFLALAQARKWPLPTPAEFVRIDLLEEDAVDAGENLRPRLRLVISR